MQDTVWTRTLGTSDREVLAVSDALPGRAETVIVGAGLIGLATAFYLTELGQRSVCVVDRTGPAAEASGANAGGLWFAHQTGEPALSADLSKLSNRLFDDLGARFACDVKRRGVLELLYDDAQRDAAQRRVAAMQAAGHRGEILSPEEVRKIEPELNVDAAGLLAPEDGQLHPVKLAAAWTRRIREAGGRVCKGIEVTGVGRIVETSGGRVHAERVVLAAGAWTPLLTAAIGWRPPIRPVRGVLLALPKGPRRLHHTVMADRYYYWQLEDGPIAGGGSEERVGFQRGVPSELIHDIRAEMAEHFPGLRNQPTEVSWYGFRPHCEDHRPIIGQAPGRDHLFAAAGHFRKGVMLAPATGKVMADLVTGRQPEVDLSPFDPARFARIPA